VLFLLQILPIHLVHIEMRIFCPPVHLQFVN
jgi:hypothetical protein